MDEVTAAEIDNVKTNITLVSDGKKEHDKLMEDENYTHTTDISGRYNSAIIARNIGMDVLLFKKYNPNLDKALGAGTIYKLKLPVEKMEIFTDKKLVILNECLMALIKLTTP